MVTKNYKRRRAVRSYPLLYYCRIIILLLATLFQTYQLTQDIRFHPDEAFFMTFARHAAVNGDWMLAGSLDKPPLSIYTSALSMVLVGNTSDSAGVLHLDPLQGEFAGRLPNVLLAIVLVALMMRLAYDLYHDEQVALLTGVLMATSPYMLSFGTTAFTDMSLLFWLVLSLWLVIRQQYGWAGLTFGLALWSKQQAVLFLPLLMMLALIYHPRRTNVLKAILTSAMLLFLLVIWDASRPENSIFLLGMVNNSSDSVLADPSSYPARLMVWLNLGSWLLSQGWITLLLALLMIVGWLYHIKIGEIKRRVDSLLVLFIVCYFVVHIVLALNQYDRYLLIILPLVILLCARGFRIVVERTMPILYALLSVILIVLAIYGLHSGFPTGGDKSENQGIDQLADYLNRKPIATVIYNRWLGWELDYYMGQWTNKRRVHFPTPQALADGAEALDEIGDRYLVAPINQPLSEWLVALERVGFAYQVDYESEQFRVYRLTRRA